MSDAAAALAALLIANTWLNAPESAASLHARLPLQLTLETALLLAAFTFAWQEIHYLFGLDEAPASTWPRQLAGLVGAAGTSSLLVLTIVPFGGGLLDVRLALATWPLGVVFGLAARRLVGIVTAEQGTAERRRILIVGSGPRAAALYRELCTTVDAPCELVGFVDSGHAAMAPEVRSRLLAPLEQLETVLMQHVIDEVLIALPVKSHYADIQRAIEDCERLGIEAKYPADIFRSTLAGSHFDETSRLPLFSVDVVVDDARRVLKRIVDIAVALSAIIALSPLLLAIAAAVGLSSRGGIIFAQERYGLRKRRFRMFKFRTMVANAPALQAQLEARNEATGPVFKIRDDPRVTPLGRFLRRTSLDEFPQLFNVLRGDMSLVGPRPLPERDVHLFREGWLMRRFSVPPGLTCLWQISGRSALGFDDWIALDLKYIDEWSLALDFEILAKTVPAVLRGEGAS